MCSPTGVNKGLTKEGGHEVMLQQQLVHYDDIPRARIVDTSYKDHSMDYWSRWTHQVFNQAEAIWLV